MTNPMCDLGCSPPAKGYDGDLSSSCSTEPRSEGVRSEMLICDA